MYISHIGIKCFNFTSLKADRIIVLKRRLSSYLLGFSPRKFQNVKRNKVDKNKSQSRVLLFIVCLFACFYLE